MLYGKILVAYCDNYGNIKGHINCKMLRCLTLQQMVHKDNTAFIRVKIIGTLKLITYIYRTRVHFSMLNGYNADPSCRAV